MKKQVILTLTALTWMFAAHAQDKPTKLAAEEIPHELILFLKKHFPNAEIKKATVEGNAADKKYEINLKDGTEIEFNSKCDVTEVENKKGIPSSVIPSNIRDQISKNHNLADVTEWSIDSETGHHEISLKKKVELEFDAKGKVITANN